ncbi:MAG: radical SAM protein, partial [Bacteroidota bacterium]
MAGIYIHIPFCKQRCTYCDFHFSTNLSYQQRMMNSISKELSLVAPAWREQRIDTIYFGGGTPSLLTSKELSSVMETIHNNFIVSTEAEVTIEANPDDINHQSSTEWKTLGVNRLSVGLQTFSQSQLEWMNRAHNEKQALECVSIANKAGINNLSLDLIYGLPNLSSKQWSETLDTLSTLQFTHLSSYILTVEDQTALKHQVDKGMVQPISETLLEEQY